MNWQADHDKNLVLSGNEKDPKFHDSSVRPNARIIPRDRERKRDEDTNRASVSAICQYCWHSSASVNLKSYLGQDIYSYIR